MCRFWGRNFCFSPHFEILWAIFNRSRLKNALAVGTPYFHTKIFLYTHILIIMKKNIRRQGAQDDLHFGICAPSFLGFAHLLIPYSI